MSGMTQRDITILTSYADAGNRELYWNYLSQLPGADGYGTLALGVVRNDSLPGAVANTYAQEFARTQHDNGSRFANTQLSERGWEEFGQTLLQKDLELRMKWMDTGRSDVALNLPGKDVMTAHDQAFEQHSLDPNCWTPRVLLQAALQETGPQKMEQIWTNMLDNANLGMNRVGLTGYDAMTQMGVIAGGQYLVKLGVIEGTQLLEGRASVDPNVIGGNSFYSMYFEAENKWANVSTGGGRVSFREETNPTRIAELNDARAVRLERQEKATQFHEDDPYRSITRSPRTAALDTPVDTTQPVTRLADIQPGHPYYGLMQQARAGVEAIDARMNRTFDADSERLTASVMALARDNGIDRADHVLLSLKTPQFEAGRHVFVVQGEPGDPAHRRASMPTEVAVQTPVEQSLQRLDVASTERQESLAQNQQQDMETQQRGNPALRMG
jgi:hypothetical protein